jgi:hypothetical protein
MRDTWRAVGWGVIAYLLHWFLLPWAFWAADMARPIRLVIV